MITIKNKDEIELMKKAGNIVYQTHQELKKHIKPGLTTKELDKIAEDFILSKEATPSFKGFNGYPKSICTSINESVVHEIPDETKLIEGDIISIDIGACYKGYHGDSAWTYKVGNVSPEKEYLMEHTKNSLFEGLKAIKEGNKLSDVSRNIETYAISHQLGIVKELCGHGVGKELHEDPQITNYVNNEKDYILKEGMTLAIEPMLTLGTADIYMLPNNWTIKTEDGKPSAHYEHTVLVKKDGYEILTGE